MCGIFGYVGVKPPDLQKMFILGLYNQTRGTDSCGLYWNGKTYKGVGPEKEFSTFIQKYDFGQFNKTNYVTIGHTRKASVGVSSLANAHPFEIYFNEDEETPKLVGVHNGTIDNWKELAKKYKVSTDNINVDSHAMMAILANPDNYGVLGEYIGGASFLFTYPEDPKSLYVWRGESRNTPESKVEVEERPLYYLTIPKEGTYISSMEEPLNIFSEYTDLIKEVPANTLFKINGAKIEFKKEISRENASQRPSYYSQNWGDSYSDSRYVAHKNKSGVNSSFNFNKSVAAYSIHDFNAESLEKRKRAIETFLATQFNAKIYANFNTDMRDSADNNYSGNVVFTGKSYSRNGNHFYCTTHAAGFDYVNDMGVFLNPDFIKGQDAFKDYLEGRTKEPPKMLKINNSEKATEYKFAYFVDGNVITSYDNYLLYMDELASKADEILECRGDEELEREIIREIMASYCGAPMEVVQPWGKEIVLDGKEVHGVLCPKFNTKVFIYYRGQLVARSYINNDRPTIEDWEHKLYVANTNILPYLKEGTTAVNKTNKNIKEHEVVPVLTIINQITKESNLFEYLSGVEINKKLVSLEKADGFTTDFGEKAKDLKKINIGNKTIKL